MNHTQDAVPDLQQMSPVEPSDYYSSFNLFGHATLNHRKSQQHKKTCHRLNPQSQVALAPKNKILLRRNAERSSAGIVDAHYLLSRVLLKGHGASLCNNTNGMDTQHMVGLLALLLGKVHGPTNILPS